MEGGQTWRVRSSVMRRIVILLRPIGDEGEVVGKRKRGGQRGQERSSRTGRVTRKRKKKRERNPKNSRKEKLAIKLEQLGVFENREEDVITTSRSS